jgi:hypothetical protein
LQFGESTAVFPIWSNSLNFESGSVDWTQAQALTSGWLRSRTRTQFLTTSHRIERGRLELTPHGTGGMHIANGLEWDIEALVVSDDSGAYYFLEQLPAGASGEMSGATAEELSRVTDLLKRNPLEPPQRVYEGRIDDVDLAFGATKRKDVREARALAQFSNNPMERRILDMQFLRSRPNVLQPRTYLALLKQNPGVDLGVDRTREYAGYHLLLGYY